MVTVWYSSVGDTMRELMIENSGYRMKAYFNELTIETIFIPLLKELTLLQKQFDRRIVVYLAAPCACGKTTLSLFLQQLSKEVDGVCELQAASFDGFHYYQEYLLNHTLIRENKEVCMVDVKGCPETFDLDKAKTKIQALHTHTEVLWPVYDRMLHNPIEDQIVLNKDIILIEGNYMLLDEEHWKDLKKECDYSIFIKAELDLLKNRLIERKQLGGTTYEDSMKFYERSDKVNAKRIMEHVLEADLVLRLIENNDYIVES